MWIRTLSFQVDDLTLEHGIAGMTTSSHGRSPCRSCSFDVYSNKYHYVHDVNLVELVSVLFCFIGSTCFSWMIFCARKSFLHVRYSCYCVAQTSLSARASPSSESNPDTLVTYPCWSQTHSDLRWSLSCVVGTAWKPWVAGGHLLGLGGGHLSLCSRTKHAVFLSYPYRFRLCLFMRCNVFGDGGGGNSAMYA